MKLLSVGAPMSAGAGRSDTGKVRISDKRARWRWPWQWHRRAG